MEVICAIIGIGIAVWVIALNNNAKDRDRAEFLAATERSNRIREEGQREAERQREEARIEHERGQREAEMSRRRARLDAEEESRAFYRRQRESAMRRDQGIDDYVINEDNR